MRVLIIDLLDSWVTVPNYFDMDQYLMFTMIMLRLWIDGSVTDIALMQMDEIWLILYLNLLLYYSCYWKLLEKYR